MAVTVEAGDRLVVPPPLIFPGWGNAVQESALTWFVDVVEAQTAGHRAAPAGAPAGRPQHRAPAHPAGELVRPLDPEALTGELLLAQPERLVGPEHRPDCLVDRPLLERCRAGLVGQGDHRMPVPRRLGGHGVVQHVVTDDGRAGRRSRLLVAASWCAGR